MSHSTMLNAAYLVAALSFIMALKGLANPKRARSGNFIAMAGMALAIGVTFFQPFDEHAGTGHLHNLIPMVIAMVLGAAIGIPTSRLVKMTAMPQLVAIFNGVGGGAAALVSIAEFIKLSDPSQPKPATYVVLEVLLGVLIGTVSFSGSAIAFIKLQELITGRPITYPGQQIVNAILGFASIALIVAILVHPTTALMWVLLAVSFVVGILVVLPIGGADVPVLISLLNSFTGLAVAASGFTLNNNLLIVAGTLVGASGLLLTQMMCKSIGRSLPNILFSAFGSAQTLTAGATEQRTVKQSSPEDIGVLLSYVQRVAIIPGYGLAVAQAQHTIRELADELEAKGIEVFYAIHPVAGRMPGHMNVLLAEANVPYEQLIEMDDANPRMSQVDVALVVGANDTVNPAARTQGSPISGMPIINADEAGQVIFFKRSMRPGFAGIDNELLFNEKTTLLFGDAKETLTKLVSAVANA
ncbi:MAG: NAD(P)(+) transhydrogenase (Re/Si-specific) subunit beta [Actinomycetes bacterium]